MLRSAEVVQEPTRETHYVLPGSSVPGGTFVVTSDVKPTRFAFMAPYTTRVAAEQALSGRANLTHRELSLAQALVQMANHDNLAACQTYASLRNADSSDFAAWFGLGECRRRDRIVLKDPLSKSGFRFRSGY